MWIYCFSKLDNRKAYLFFWYLKAYYVSIKRGVYISLSVKGSLKCLIKTGMWPVTTLTK